MTRTRGAQGAERLIELVADADDAVFLDIEQRRVAWGQRWDGLVAWFAAVDGRSRVAELDRRTTTAVRELTGLLRRLMEVRGRGASRATDMVDLARWFWGLHERPDGTAAAHALFDVCFGLGGSRHLARTLDEPDDHPPSTPWVDGPRVLVPSSLRDRGRVPSPGSTAAVPDDRRDRERMRRREQHLLDAEQTATRSLAAGALGTRVLSAAELGALLRLVDLALVAGVPVAGEVAVATMGPVHVRVTAAESDCIVQAETGVLRLRGVEVTVAGR